MTAATAVRVRPALHHLLLDAARAAPRAPAVVEVGPGGEPAVCTYRELLERAETFAAALAGAGLGPGSRVVVDAVTGVPAVAMLMGCSMAGATFLPLTPEVPDARARQIVELADPHGYAAADGGRADRLTDRTDLGLVGFRRTGGHAVARPAGRVAEPDPDDPLAYLIYTSGSTGLPKGVAMPQRATSAFFAATRGMLRPTDRVASTAPLHFDFCLLDIGVCLANRCALVPVPRDLLRWPRRLVATLAGTGCTRVHAVPSVWRPLLRREPHLLSRLPALDTVLYSGESFPPDELAALHRGLPGTRVVSCYGPTECMACSFTDVTDFADGSAGPLPVDGAYPGSALEIVDEAGVPVAGTGRPGQLRFTGPSVFAGYWTPAGPRRPDTVRPGPDGTPTLLTGDYAHRGADGRLYFAGRRDRQVKVAGNRVELGEIEATLTRVAGAEEARVVADDRDGTPTLVAFVAGPGARDPDALAAACRAACVRRLPHYMVPARVVALPELPRTGTGKVDQPLLLRACRADRPAAVLD